MVASVREENAMTKLFLTRVMCADNARQWPCRSLCDCPTRHEGCFCPLHFEEHRDEGLKHYRAQLEAMATRLNGAAVKASREIPPRAMLEALAYITAGHDNP
jgi:hypothetical protein